MKKKFLFISLLILMIGQNIQADQPEIIEKENSYTLMIQAGREQKATKKIELVKQVVQETDSLVPYLTMLESYFVSGQLGKIITLLEEKKELKTLVINHPHAGLLVVKTLARLGQQNEATQLLVKLNEKNPTNPEVALLTAQLYEQRSELHKALDVINNYLNKSPKRTTNFAFLLVKKRIYLRLGDKQKALESLQEALHMQPRFDAGWLMFAQMQEAEGQIEAAIKGYSNYLEIASPKQKNFATNMLFKAIEGKLLQLMFSNIMKNQSGIKPNEQQQFKNKIMKLFEQKKYKNALEELDKRLSQHSGTDTEKLLKIQALGALQRYEDAAQQLQAWIIEDPENTLWFETLHLLYHAGLDSLSLINTLKTIEAHHPHNLQVSLYLADMLTRNMRYPEAIAYHKKSLGRTDDPVLQTSILFQLGFLYYELKQFKKLKIALEKGKDLGLDYPPLLNLLAYYYTSYENNPDKAQPLMDIVLQEVPDNPHFLDTQALIYYKQEKFVKALTLLEKIAKQEPDDVTILKHLAKTYTQLGMLDRGVAQLERVITLTYDKKKKKRYEQLAKTWKKKAHEEKHNLLCCR